MHALQMAGRDRGKLPCLTLIGFDAARHVPGRFAAGAGGGWRRTRQFCFSPNCHEQLQATGPRHLDFIDARPYYSPISRYVSASFPMSSTFCCSCPFGFLAADHASTHPFHSSNRQTPMATRSHPLHPSLELHGR